MGTDAWLAMSGPGGGRTHWEAEAKRIILAKGDGHAMTQTFDLEGVDLAAMVSVLRRACGSSVMGAVVGRTRLRDEVTRQLGCSLLMGEMIIDTMISRGFIRQHVHAEGWVYWDMLQTATPEGG
jgi:hypothetical protein